MTTRDDPRRVRIRPAEGLRIRDPKTLLPVPAEGLEVQLTTFWRRRIADGDVVEVQDKSRTAAKGAAASAKGA